MEYMGNKEFWDKNFSSRGDKVLEPEASLVSKLKYFKAGSVVDIACGDGRNSLFLLKNNFLVTGVDFSAKALERLERFAADLEYSVDTQQLDLSTPSSLSLIGVFDNIVVNHYRLSREHLKELEQHINKGGILFISGFGHKHKVDQRIRKEDLIYPEDMEVLKHSFDLLEYEEKEDDRGFFVTYVFLRK